MRTRYGEVAARLVDGIRTGVHPVGSLLPSEKRLAELYGVSRATVRSALLHVEDLGLVDRRQGSGTRVTAAEVRPEYVHRMIASGDLMEFAGPSSRRIHLMEDVVADEDLAPRLDGRPGRRWLRIGQTRHVEGIGPPVCWTDVYVAADYAAVRDRLPSHRGLVYALVEEAFGITIVEITQEIRSVGVPDELAERLGAAPDGHALELTRRYRDADGGTAICAISVLPADRYAFRMTLRRSPAQE
jgi:DNA-binding GntR family transcriptional regulator